MTGRGEPPQSADVGPDEGGGATGEEPDERRGTSRRTLLVAGAAALIGGAAVATGALRDGRGPERGAAASPETTRVPPPVVTGPLADVLRETEATAGRRLVGSPWSSWFGSAPAEWSSVYASWLLRDRGAPKTADVAALHEFYRQTGNVGSSPTPGALIFYFRGPVPPHHVGLVTSVTQGVPQTAEGDHPMNLPHAERFVRRFARPWDVQIRYAYPAYG